MVWELVTLEAVSNRSFLDHVVPHHIFEISLRRKANNYLVLESELECEDIFW